MRATTAELIFKGPNLDPPQRVDLKKIGLGIGGIAMIDDATREFFETSGVSTAAENHEAFRPGEAQSVRELLERREIPVSDGWPIIFHGLEEGETAYNASNIFHVEQGDEKIPHVLVRVEGNRPDQELTSRLTVWRCSEDGTECWPANISNLHELVAGKIVQDPAISFVKGQPVISWVEVTPPNSPSNPSKDSTWESFACTGESLDQMKPLVASPKGSKTKELRFVDLLDRGIGVFSRPDLGGRKKICFGIAKNWEDITPEFLSSLKEVQGLSVGGAWGGLDDVEMNAKNDIEPDGIIRNDVESPKLSTSEALTADGTVRDKADITMPRTSYDDIELDQQIWGGPNSAEMLPNYDISLGMHFGWYEKENDTGGDPIEDNKKYVGGHCIVELPEGDEPAQAKHLKVVVEREDFKNVKTPPKRPGLSRVFFLNFIKTRNLNSPTSIAVGSVGDAVQAGIEIPNPLLNGWLKDHPEYAESSSPESADQFALVA